MECSPAAAARGEWLCLCDGGYHWRPSTSKLVWGWVVIRRWEEGQNGDDDLGKESTATVGTAPFPSSAQLSRPIWTSASKIIGSGQLTISLGVLQSFPDCLLHWMWPLLPLNLPHSAQTHPIAPFCPPPAPFPTLPASVDPGGSVSVSRRLHALQICSL